MFKYLRITTVNQTRTHEGIKSKLIRGIFGIACFRNPPHVNKAKTKIYKAVRFLHGYNYFPRRRTENKLTVFENTVLTRTFKLTAEVKQLV